MSEYSPCIRVCEGETDVLFSDGMSECSPCIRVCEGETDVLFSDCMSECPPCIRVCEGETEVLFCFQIVCRSALPVSESVKEKLMFCFVFRLYVGVLSLYQSL